LNGPLPKLPVRGAAAMRARAYATIGEMCDVLREVWGEYVEDAFI